MEHHTIYTSCNSNQTPTAVDWGENNLICYASCNSVRIYDPNFGSGGKVVTTLIGHSKRVNSVKWINGTDNDLISGSTDHTAIVWSWLEYGQWNPFVLTGHDSNVNLVDGIRNNGQTIVVTVSMDCSVKIWARGATETFNLLQTIDLGLSVSVGVAISLLPGLDTVIIACALDNSTIDLYVQEQEFQKLGTLKGHEDWVRGLDFTNDDRNDLILATASQDCYIRLWRFSLNSKSLGFINFYTKEKKYSVTLDSVLTGHEGWVYSVNWKHNQLLSASVDKSMIIWELSDGLWLEKVRVGEVGGNTLGFYGCCFAPDGQSILGHDYLGALHIWKLHNDEWRPQVTVGGHFKEVTDLGWEPEGEFLVTASNDQTTRIHAPWPKPDRISTWHEIARPQIHGYDLSALAILSRYKFASSAEEKIIRTFQASSNFVDNFKRLCKVDDDVCMEAEGAAIPSLGLSNKAVFQQTDTNNDETHFTPVILNAPPTEETLLQNTLWPEIQKLYGHGYEVYSLAASSDGKFLASACKSTTVEHAAILLWDTSSWTLLQKLHSHTLTVVQLAFSPDSQYLLSVSRDRRWSLFLRKENDSFELIATVDKKTSIHTRIIWCCAWTGDSKYFVTGSRDGTAVIWSKNEDNQYIGSKFLELKNESVTALAVAPEIVSSNYIIAVGLESGIIQLHNWTIAHCQILISLDRSFAHHLTVKRLCFRPQRKSDNSIQLASCSSDHSVIIHEFVIK